MADHEAKGHVHRARFNCPNDMMTSSHVMKGCAIESGAGEHRPGPPWAGVLMSDRDYQPTGRAARDGGQE